MSSGLALGIGPSAPERGGLERDFRSRSTFLSQPFLRRHPPVDAFGASWQFRSAAVRGYKLLQVSPAKDHGSLLKLREGLAVCNACVRVHACVSL